MANFEAKIRVDYRDIPGLILDCPSGALAVDGSGWSNTAPAPRVEYRGNHTGAGGASSLTDTARHWRDNQLAGCMVWNTTDGSQGYIVSNTENNVVAALSGGVDDDWDTGDEYVVTTYRLGDPYQPVSGQRPVVAYAGGFLEATFDRTAQSHLIIPADYPLLGGRFTVLLDYTAYGTGAASQTVLGFPNFRVHRTDAAGDYAYEYNSTVVPDSGDMADGLWGFLPARGTLATAEMYLDGVSVHSGSYASTDIASGTAAGYIGCKDGATGYCSMRLRGIAIWGRPLSPLELDFACHTFGTGGSVAQENRCGMERRRWTDPTAGATLSRVNPSIYAPGVFKVALMSGAYPRIQIGCTQNGILSPDLPGGNNYQLTVVEQPGNYPPAVIQQSNWSAVIDCGVVDAGHYTLLVSRATGGAQVLHIDAEMA